MHHAGTHVWIGSILRETGRDREALRHFERAIQADPILAEAHLGIGLIHLRNREWDRADTALTRAATFAPDNSRVRAALGELEAARLKGERRR
ncbi:MAG: tetratricopeptide repeat protein [Acidobacteriota bacterium]